MHGVVDLMIGVPVAGDSLTVRIQKQADRLSVEVKHRPTNTVIMSRPLASREYHQAH